MNRDSNCFFVLLGLLCDRSQSGYGMKKVIEQSIGHFYKISNSQIYPTLKRLEALGHVTMHVEHNDGKPDSKLYAITASGREAFLQWVRKPVDYQNPIGNELLLKLFFGAHAPLEDSLRLLDAYRREKERFLEQYKQIARTYYGELPDRQSVFGFSALRYGMLLDEFCLKWCDETEARLRGMEEADHGGHS